MVKKDFGNAVGKCSVCTINLWDASGGEPAVWPCNLEGCPYEKPEEQNRHFSLEFKGQVGSGLGQIDF